MKRTPPPPYTTSTLQQDGARRMGLSGKRTMSLAKKLYEEGYITYHRTDSYQIFRCCRKQMDEYVKKEYGEKYVIRKAKIYTKLPAKMLRKHTRQFALRKLVFRLESEPGFRCSVRKTL